MASEWPTIRISDFSKSGTTESTTDVTKIVDEFHHLYNERLRTLELTNPGSTDLKINALEEWIRDLTEQNKMLVKTVENLEKNAIDRVDTLDCVLKSKATEKQTVCQDCTRVSKSLQEVKTDLENANRCIIEKERLLKEYVTEVEVLRNSVTASAKQVEQNNSVANEELEQTVFDLEAQLSENEKLLEARTEELEHLKYKFIEKEKLNQMLKSEADKTRIIPQMQEAIGLLKDAIKEKDCILEQYHQEINCLKEEVSRMEEQDCKLYQLEDTIKYYEQCLKQKELMLEKLKEHIKELRLCLAQSQCQQDKGMISRSSSTEEHFNSAEWSGYVPLHEDVIMAGGDSLLIDELKKKLVNEKDMQVALTAEVAEKHDAIMRLKEHVKELEDQLRQSDMQTHFKDDIIRQLRKEVKLGRAKESLAEMLGLKGGPRAQMKAKIDHLHSELEEREIEISRLEGKLEASRLPTVEAKLTKLELELVDRDRTVLALCDKLDYVRRYLGKLRGSDEDMSVKCGLEALLLELSEDVEWTIETRRNVSMPLNEDPKESIIIISHRSHSLPDTTLQKQVQSFKATSEVAVFSDSENQFLEKNCECHNMKKQISTLEYKLSETLVQLDTMWETMKKCELENGDSVLRGTQEIQSTIENEHSQLLQVNSEMQFISERIDELNTLGTNNDYLVHCIEKCLIDCSAMLGKQKTFMGLATESSSGSLVSSSEAPVEIKYILCAEATLGDSISLLQQLKTKLSVDESASKLSIDKTKDLNNLINNLISSKQTVLDRLCLVNLSQDEISKKIFKKFSDFDKIFGIHQNVVKALKFVLNHFIFNDFISKNSDKVPLEICCDGDKENNKVNELKATASEDNGMGLKKLRSLRRNRLSRSSPSIGEEYHSDVLGNIHMKTSHLQQIALALKEEIKSYLKEVLNREDKIRQFVSESQDLNKTLSNLSKELCASEKVLAEKNTSSFVPSLQTIMSQAQTEVELLLCKVDDFKTYKEMYDMNRSKMEQEINELQKDMFTVVSDIMDAIKASQEYDNNLLNNYRTKIQSYREKVEQLEKHLTNSIDQKEVGEKEEDEDLICKLTEEIEKYQVEVEKLKNSIQVVKNDKESVELENQKVMEELQSKICTLQAALQNDVRHRKDQQHSVSSKSWFLSWPYSKQIYSRHIHDV